jgi:hypothetical protein
MLFDIKHEIVDLYFYFLLYILLCYSYLLQVKYVNYFDLFYSLAILIIYNFHYFNLF